MGGGEKECEGERVREGGGERKTCEVRRGLSISYLYQNDEDRHENHERVNIRIFVVARLFLAWTGARGRIVVLRMIRFNDIRDQAGSDYFSKRNDNELFVPFDIQVRVERD